MRIVAADAMAATLSEDGYFTPLFGASIDLDGDHPAEARHAWAAVKGNGRKQ